MLDEFLNLLDTVSKAVKKAQEKQTAVSIKDARAEILELQKSCKDARVALQEMKNKK